MMSIQDTVAFITLRLPELWTRIGEHLMLTGISTSAAVVLGIPIAVLIFRIPMLQGPTLGLIGILQTIPSLAMLVFLLTLLQKIGAIPALMALSLYALLPIVRNTLTGLDEVSPQLTEAARGIGMTPSQELRLVLFPLAAPVILAGIRTAAVVGVGIATLSAFIGAGGLGQFINRGLALSNTGLILLGAGPAALLALLVDFSIGAVAWAIRPETRRKKGTSQTIRRGCAFAMPCFLIILGVCSYMTSFGAGTRTERAAGPGKKTITIASKNFTEQLILGEIMAQLIEARTELAVARRFNLGGTMICHGALAGGEVDIYAEYTGTALTAILKHPVISDPEAALGVVSEAYRKRFNLVWLKPFGFDNTYAVTVRMKDAAENGWKSISDLSADAQELRAGFTAEFSERPDGFPGLRQAYYLEFRDVVDLDPSLMYRAIAEGEVDVICAFATDSRIALYHLEPMVDDRRFFPPYQAAPVVREETLQSHPELESLISLLGGIMDNSTMQGLNFEVDHEKKSPAGVARRFLINKKLISIAARQK